MSKIWPSLLLQILIAPCAAVTAMQKIACSKHFQNGAVDMFLFLVFIFCFVRLSLFDFEQFYLFIRSWFFILLWSLLFLRCSSCLSFHYEVVAFVLICSCIWACTVLRHGDNFLYLCEQIPCFCVVSCDDQAAHKIATTMGILFQVYNVKFHRQVNRQKYFRFAVAQCRWLGCRNNLMKFRHRDRIIIQKPLK